MMRNALLVLASACLFCSFAPASTSKTINLKDGSGKSVGTAKIRQSGTGVEVHLKLHHMTPGDHAVHFHQEAKCQGPDFQSAGPHFNPGGKKYGLKSPEGHHAGDMENFVVPANGKLTVTAVNKDITLEKDKPNSVFQTDGTALVIHAGKDDYTTDPAGNAGDRIACGVIK